ncbi:MAG: rhomboid family intramembrane serine protease, partial [Victivallaceae bacterium]|nr:rhomboid family intramembrane serine protease [Victivallaceae bacterium]
MGLHDRDYMRGGRPTGNGGMADNGLGAMWALIGVNVVLYLLVPATSPLYAQMALTNSEYAPAQLYQVLTAIFLHGSFGHLFFNMFGLYVFGKLIAPMMSAGKFLGVFLTGGLLGNLIYLAVFNGQPFILVGASGGVFSVMIACAMLRPNEQFVLIFMPFWPIKTSTLVIAYTVLELISQFSGAGGNVAHLAHLGGFAGGYLFVRIF